jgi:hypothetical protein
MKPYFGYAEKVTFGINEVGVRLESHNSYIDMALRYGVFFSLLALAFWLSLLFSRKVGYINDNYKKCFYALFFVITDKSLVSNIFWVNMGDGVTYSALFFMIYCLCMGRVNRSSLVASKSNKLFL